VTTVRSGHVRGLTPALSITDMAFGSSPRKTAWTKRTAVPNGHVRGLTPGMAKGDT
jgi:hypothetical protein